MNKANNLEDIGISLDKIEGYLINDEKDGSYISRLPSSDQAPLSVTIRNGGFYWQR
jgi:hypothetical protein